MSPNSPENDSNEQPLAIGDGESDSTMKSSRKFDSMVLGDGTFEALMKERSKVRRSVLIRTFPGVHQVVYLFRQHV